MQPAAPHHKALGVTTFFKVAAWLCRGLRRRTQPGRLLRRAGTLPLGSKGYRPRSCPGDRDWIEAFRYTMVMISFNRNMLDSHQHISAHTVAYTHTLQTQTKRSPKAAHFEPESTHPKTLSRRPGWACRAPRCLCCARRCTLLAPGLSINMKSMKRRHPNLNQQKSQ